MRVNFIHEFIVSSSSNAIYMANQVFDKFHSCIKEFLCIEDFIKNMLFVDVLSFIHIWISTLKKIYGAIKEKFSYFSGNI